jgi:hypothetical protein
MSLAEQVQRRLAHVASHGEAWALAVQHAEPVLARLCAGLKDSAWPDMVDHFSRLTNTGIPLEMSWSSRDPALRWTAEVGPPELADAQRLAHAWALAGWPLERCPAWLREGQSEASSSRPLKYGAWLAGRQRGPNTEYKVYAEWAGDLPQQFRSAHACLAADWLQWTMIGVHSDGGLEFYARSSALTLQSLSQLGVMPVALSGAWVQHVKALTGGHDLPRPSGLSLSFAASGQWRSATWFTFAKALFRDDEQTHACLQSLNLCAVSSQLLSALMATAPCVSTSARWRFGMLGAGIQADGSAWWQAGIRP